MSFKSSATKRVEALRALSSCTGSVFVSVLNRVKRCSKSPHHSGPPTKILPSICPKQQIKIIDGVDKRPHSIALQNKEVEQLIQRPFRGLENLPFKDLNDELMKNETTRKKSTVISTPLFTWENKITKITAS